jgi:hypothetical protein
MPRHSRASATDGFEDSVRPPAQTFRRRTRTLLHALIPTTLAAGLVSAATAAAPKTASHSAPVQVSRQQCGRGFKVWNGGTHSLKLVGLTLEHSPGKPHHSHVLPAKRAPPREVPQDGVLY